MRKTQRLVLSLSALCWPNLANSSAINQSVLGPNLQLLLMLISFITLSGLILLIWNRYLRRRLTTESRPPWMLLLLSVCGYLLLVSSLAGFALDQINRQLRQDMGESLSAVNDAVVQALLLWQEQRTDELTYLAAEEHLSDLALQLFEQQNRGDTDTAAKTRARLRVIYGPRIDQLGGEAFGLIGIDSKTLSWLNPPNLTNSEELLDRFDKAIKAALAGNTGFIPPFLSGQALPGRNVEYQRHAMFFMAPIRTRRDQIVGILVVRFNPLQEFASLTQAGRFSDSGETYLFDNQARALTESRFADQLATLQPLFRNSSRISGLTLRDPGGNLLEGHRPVLDRSDWPLTRSAQAALAGQSGVDTSGYRDYRGAPVMGAWHWSEQLQIGSATEIDQLEALASYLNMRRLLILSLAGSVLLTLILAGLGVWIGENARRRLRDELQQRTEQLQQSQQRFELAVQGSGDGLWEYNTQLDQCWFSPRFEALVGRATNSLKPTIEAWRELLHPSDITRVTQEFDAHLLHDHEYETECRMRVGDAQYRWFRIRAQTLRDAQGKPLRTSGSISDISSHKEAEQALDQQRELLNSVLEHSPAIIYVKDLEGRYLLHSRGWSEATGLDQSRTLGATDHELLPPDLAQTLIDNDQQAIQQGQMIRLNERLPSLDGSRIKTFISYKFPIRDRHGAVFAVGGISSDITEITELTEQLEQSKFHAEQANQANAELLRELVEQVESPLQQINQLRQIADPCTAKGRAALQQIESVIEPLLQLLTELKGDPASTDPVPLHESASSSSNLYALPRGCRVLTVDDNAVDRDLMGTILQQLGVDQDSASDGEQALQLLQQNFYDLILLDLEMPGLDGFAVANQIRRSEGCEQLPIIAVTGHDSDDVRRHCLEQGFSDFLSKPINTEQLGQCLQHWLTTQTLQMDTDQDPAKTDPIATSDISSAPPTDLSLETSTQPIDRKLGLEMVGGMETAYQRLLQNFTTEYSNSPQTLRQHWQQQQLEPIREAAHSLKSTAAYLGAQQLTEQAARLEQAIKQQQDELKSIFEAFISELERVLSALEDLQHNKAPVSPSSS